MQPVIRSVDVKSVEDRVGLINYYIQQGRKDPSIRRLASRILTQRCGNSWCVEEKDWFGEVSAIFGWMRHNTRYTLDPYSLELFQKPKRAVQFGTTDCDDQTILAGSLLQSVGYPVRIVIIDTGHGGWSHVYLHIGLPPMDPRRWISFDLTATKEQLGWEMPAQSIKRKRVFEIPEAE